MKLFSSKNNSKPKKSFLIDAEDIYSDLAGKKGSTLFLGKYTFNEIEEVLKKKGFYRDVQKRGLWPIKFALDSTDYPPLQRLQIFYKKIDPDNLVADLKIREGRLAHRYNEMAAFPISGMKFLILEWLTMQNPRLSFDSEATPLPGQKHPGLNIGRKVLRLFVYLGRITKNNGLLAYPAYFHNALLFSRSFRFLNPEKEGEVIAIRRSFPKIPFKQLAWIVHLNCLRTNDGGIYEWNAEEQIYPLHPFLKNYFESSDYKNRVKKVQKSRLFTVAWKCFEKKMKDISLTLP